MTVQSVSLGRSRSEGQFLSFCRVVAAFTDDASDHGDPSSMRVLHGDTQRRARQIRRILLLEDNEPNAEVFIGYLEVLGYPEPDVARSLAEFDTFVPAILNAHYDLVVMDIMLPDGESVDIAKHLSEHCSVPAMAYTARTGPQFRAALCEVGFQAVLEKPLSLKVLRSHFEDVFGTVS